MREVLRNLGLVRRRPPFGRFWLGMAISRTGDAFTTVALSWLVLDIAGPAELGIVLLCFGLPRLAGGPVAGRLLDRFQPRTLLSGDNAVRGLLIAVLPALDYLGSLQIGYIYAVAVLSAALATVTEVAERTVVPKLVDDEELEGANSLLSMNWEIAYIVGPPLAGFLIVAIGAPSTLLVDAASFAVMSLLCVTLPYVPIAARQPSERPGGFARNWLGFGALFRFPAVLVLTVTTVGFLFLGGITEVFYPVFVRESLNAGPDVFGLLVAATGVGALLGVLLGVPLFRRLSPHLRVSAVLISGAPFFALLSVVGNVGIAVALVAVAYVLWGPYYAIQWTLMQRLVPEGSRNQVIGARMAVSPLGFPLGSAAGGFLLANASIDVVIVGMSVAYGALALLPLLSASLRRTVGQPTPHSDSNSVNKHTP